jgi:O-antigen/teichoic acid export membrane protein
VTTLLTRAWGRVPRWMIAVGDQGMVAVINLCLSIAVTQVAGVSTLGRFALISSTILFCLGLARLFVSDPWLASRTAVREPVPALRWLVLLCALATAGVVAIVVLLACGGEARWFLACAVAPVVIVQDFGRYVAFRVERAERAFASDCTVLVVAAVIFGVCALFGRAELTTILVAWLVGLVIGTAVAWPRMAGPIHWTGSAAWWVRYCRSLSSKLALDGLAYLVGVNGSLFLLAYLASQRDVGLVRIVQTMFSPAVLTITGLTMWLVPFLANRDLDRAADVRRRATVWLAVGTGPLIVLAVLLGPRFARLVFGVHRAPGTGALLLAGLSTLAMAVAAPWVSSARVSGHYFPIAWARASAAVVTLVGMGTITALRGTTGYMGLLAFQNTTVAVVAVLIGLHTRDVARSAESASWDPATRRRAPRQ